MDKNTGFFDLDAAIETARKSGAASRGFFAVDELKAALVTRREDRIQRAKDILQICRSVQLDGSVCNGDLLDEALAQRLADLIWE